MDTPRGPLVHTAEETTRWLLAGFPTRFRHTSGVVQRAYGLIRTIDPVDADLLVAAAWLHDIGYAPQLHQTGFHPLDGALFLEHNGWLRRLCGLVAFHSGAYFVAVDLGLGAQLRSFRDEQGPVADALTFADQTTAPNGEPVDIEHRMQDMLRRHGPDSPNARVHHQRGPYLLAVADRVRQRLAER